MSLLVEIATRAEVPVEAVVRVLTREPVSDAAKSRVLAVLDGLDAEETRVLQRFALAAVHDVLPREMEHETVVAELVDAPLELPEAVRLELEPGRSFEIEEAEIEEHGRLPAEAPAFDPAPLVQLGSVLGELTEAVRELRHETDAERRERVDDLAVLIDLITKGWQGVDRRLGRVERQLGRLEAPPPQRELAARIEPPPVPAPPEPPAPEPDGGGDEEGDRDAGSTLRKRLPLIAALAFGIAIGAIAALDLDTRFDASAVVSDRSEAAESPRPQPATGPARVRRALPAPVAAPSLDEPDDAAATGADAPPPRRPAATTTAKAPAATTTTAAAAKPKPKPAAKPAAPVTTEAPPETTTRAATTTAPPRTTTERAPAPQAPSQFRPSRNWAWPPTPGADYYFVEFFRAGQSLYRARPTEPRLTLPESVVFVPGIYRWRVRPGHGAPSENRLDEPIVDSEFVLPR